MKGALNLPETSAFIGVSAATVQKMVRQDEFPKPRLLSARRIGWLVRELEEWLQDRPVADLLPPVNSRYGRAGKPV